MTKGRWAFIQGVWCVVVLYVLYGAGDWWTDMMVIIRSRLRREFYYRYRAVEK